MSYARTLALTALAMLAFAGNSLLCRAALSGTGIDPASFTMIRLVSGAAALWLLTRGTSGQATHDANWRSAAALFVYAAAFSFAYVSLPAASGALILFGAVQATMIGHGLWRGERFRGLQWVGLLVACAGLVGLLLPGISAPPMASSALMLGAGIAWGIYSLRGAKGTAAALTTAGNFWRAAAIALLLYALFIQLTFPDGTGIDRAGLAYALASGAITSGLGYVIWYMALPGLKAISAASAQLSVPLIAALGGVVLLGEPFNLRLAIATVAILGGIGLVIYKAR
jgi:drug/metabolite transporter (DMT)-like permease